jgi:predicted nucleotidyltransferase component of viral defense system
MNMFPKKDIIEEVSQIKGMSEAFIEKDWFVTQAIKIISMIRFEDYSIVFTGGTALSKAHQLIQRFSEDVDFRVLTPSLEQANKSQQSKILSAFKAVIINHLRAYFEIKEEQITARNGNKFIAIEINYPTFFTRADTLRPHILLELTVSELLLPTVYLPVSSIINQVSKKESEIKNIACINPVENAADKLSAITWRIADRVRGSKNDSPDIVRHIHDLAILKDLAVSNKLFSELVKLALERDKNRSELIKDLSVNEKLLNMIRIISSDSEYPKEYKKFVNAMSYASSDSIPTFKAAVESVTELAKIVINNQ